MKRKIIINRAGKAIERNPVNQSEHGTVTRDLATGRVTGACESGGYVREELGEPMRYDSANRDAFEIADDEPTSATVRPQRWIEVSRGD